VNGRKTKQLLFGSAIKDPPPQINLSVTPVEHVTTFKLLGVHVASDLKWTQHIDAITSKAALRLHFLKQLKRSGAGSDDLLYFYVTVIRTVLEYACPVWHSSLTATQTKALESRTTTIRCRSSEPDSTPSIAVICSIVAGVVLTGTHCAKTLSRVHSVVLCRLQRLLMSCS